VYRPFASPQPSLANLYLTSLNPRDGCVITHSNGQLLGRGHTQRAGGPNAEIMALRDAWQGHSVTDVTAYVTLEPCSHHGRTGPCCDALIAAGIRKVIATQRDFHLRCRSSMTNCRRSGTDVKWQA